MNQRADYTFKFNTSLGRHGWLRLTPAYSVKLVRELLVDASKDSLVFDPFSGTGTTGLVAAEFGINAALNDVNPFLIWFAKTKCKNYSFNELSETLSRLETIIDLSKQKLSCTNWVPPIHNIERWWDKSTLKSLGALRHSLVEIGGMPDASKAFSLYWIAFCRLVIETSSAAFNHVSMSFKEKPEIYENRFILNLFTSISEAIFESVKKPVSGNVTVFHGDSRTLEHIEGIKFSHVITSPPYSNRISYIRELRPYMYWLGFLHAPKDAGDLDWEAIGGTWGTATSKLTTWVPASNGLPDSLYTICDRINKSSNKHSDVLSKYVLKYYHDMYKHLESLRSHLTSDAKLGYIVGNSTFYGIHVPSDDLLKASLTSLGYDDVQSHIIRKRNCKKELFEYCISAVWQKKSVISYQPFRNHAESVEQLSMQLV